MSDTRDERIITAAWAVIATADEMPEDEPETLQPALRDLRLALNTATNPSAATSSPAGNTIDALDRLGLPYHPPSSPAGNDPRDETIERLTRALRVASHSPHDQAGEPVEGFPVCSICGAIQTDPSPAGNGEPLDERTLDARLVRVREYDGEKWVSLADYNRSIEGTRDDAAELRAALERAVRLLESIDAPVARGHDARVTSETWLDAIRPEIRRLRGDLAALRGQPETPGGKE